jgi:hypothetical protein
MHTSQELKAKNGAELCHKINGKTKVAYFLTVSQKVWKQRRMKTFKSAAII